MHHLETCRQNASGATFSLPSSLLASFPWRELDVFGIVWEFGVSQWLRTTSEMGMCLSLGHKMTPYPEAVSLGSSLSWFG